MKMYDYLVVGSGLFGAVFARQATDAGKTVLVIDKRPNVAGNVYTEKVEGINFHKYGAHIFHTNNTEVWNYVNRFATFNRFTNSPVANYKGELYSMPFNMYTFNKMWGVVTPEEAAAKIEEQKKEITGEPRNLEEQAISLVGRDIYDKLLAKYVKFLKDGLYELRIEWQGNIYRIFFCYDEGRIVILFNGFQKKTQKTPDREIDKALKLKKEYYERKRTEDV